MAQEEILMQVLVQMDDEEKAMVQDGNAGPSRQPANGEQAETSQAPPMVVDRHAFVRTEEEDDTPMRIVKDYQRPSVRFFVHILNSTKHAKPYPSDMALRVPPLPAVIIDGRPLLLDLPYLLRI